MFVTSETDTGLTILYDNPREVGADRIVNGVAAFHRYGGRVLSSISVPRSPSMPCPRTPSIWRNCLPGDWNVCAGAV